MSCNRLKLNEDKTEALKMGTKAKCKSVQCDRIKVGNSDIPFKPHVKNLGVYLDSNLDMTRQVSHICSSTYLEIRRIGVHEGGLFVCKATHFENEKGGSNIANVEILKH